MIPLDGRVPSSELQLLGGVAEASMNENEKGTHVELWIP